MPSLPSPLTRSPSSRLAAAECSLYWFHVPRASSWPPAILQPDSSQTPASPATKAVGTLRLASLPLMLTNISGRRSPTQCPYSSASLPVLPHLVPCILLPLALLSRAALHKRGVRWTEHKREAIRQQDARSHRPAGIMPCQLYSSYSHDSSYNSLFCAFGKVLFRLATNL